MINLRIKGLFLIIFAFVLVVVVGIATFILENGNTQKPSIPPVPIPENALPTSSSNALSKPAFQFSKEKSTSLIDKMKTRTALSDPDAAIRKSLVDSLGNVSGQLYKTSAFQISYLKAPDIFQAEILTADIASAKQNTSNWFLTKGLSQTGLCNLPVMFYLSPAAMNQIRGKNVVLNPLPEGC